MNWFDENNFLDVKNCMESSMIFFVLFPWKLFVFLFINILLNNRHCYSPVLLVWSSVSVTLLKKRQWFLCVSFKMIRCLISVRVLNAFYTFLMEFISNLSFLNLLSKWQKWAPLSVLCTTYPVITFLYKIKVCQFSWIDIALVTTLRLKLRRPSQTVT